MLSEKNHVIRTCVAKIYALFPQFFKGKKQNLQIFSLFGCIAPLLGTGPSQSLLHWTLTDKQTGTHVFHKHSLLSQFINGDGKITTIKTEIKILTLTLKLTRPIMTSLNSIVVYDKDLSSSKLALIPQLLK